MAETDMKQKVVKGLFWKLLENGGAQGIQFVIAIILARLLTPAQYGVVGIIMIFITIANVFVQSGFSTALVQKQKADEVDFSSVCYFELAVALVMYVLLYQAAPSIASFYGIAELMGIVRVLAFVLFPGAVISVQTAYVSRNMEFKGLFFSTLAASAVSGVISIGMAASGLGVWAMVGQQISYYISLMLVLFITVRWRPRLCFAVERVQGMFAFGWKLLCASLLDTVFNNLYGLLIGKIYNEELLGSYNRGEQFPKLIATNLGAAIQAVLLPAFSARQDDKAAVREMVRRAIRLSSFAVIPMLLGLFAVADTLVLALLGEKWMICVPFLRIMCISYCFWPIHITNLQAINAMGRSDIFLKLEIVKKGLSLLALVVGMQFNVYIMVCLKAFQDFVCTFINAAPNRKLLDYSIFHQWMDVMPSAALSAVMCAVVMAAGSRMPEMSVWLKLAVQIVCGAAVYAGLAWAFKLESFCYLWGMVKNRLRGKD
ncbi:lipopolysaccharide biosynthesis protein [Clostridium sp. AN503]|uniref:lipopolysaccharide biosynthesis protein n=1 Tax=Clostridium sp. AN503 TaxID=3160598 RepID=UPI003459E7D0